MAPKPIFEHAPCLFLSPRDRKGSLKKGAIRRHVVSLEKKGLLRRIERYDKDRKGRTSNEYELYDLVEAVKKLVNELPPPKKLIAKVVNQ
jgi:predicted transcriptional regulator